MPPAKLMPFAAFAVGPFLLPIGAVAAPPYCKCTVEVDPVPPAVSLPPVVASMGAQFEARVTVTNTTQPQYDFTCEYLVDYKGDNRKTFAPSFPTTPSDELVLLDSGDSVTKSVTYRPGEYSDGTSAPGGIESWLQAGVIVTATRYIQGDGSYVTVQGNGCDSFTEETAVYPATESKLDQGFFVNYPQQQLYSMSGTEGMHLFEPQSTNSVTDFTGRLLRERGTGISADTCHDLYAYARSQGLVGAPSCTGRAWIPPYAPILPPWVVEGPNNRVYNHMPGGGGPLGFDVVGYGCDCVADYSRALKVTQVESCAFDLTQIMEISDPTHGLIGAGWTEYTRNPMHGKVERVGGQTRVYSSRGGVFATEKGNTYHVAFGSCTHP